MPVPSKLSEPVSIQDPQHRPAAPRGATASGMAFAIPTFFDPEQARSGVGADGTLRSDLHSGACFSSLSSFPLLGILPSGGGTEKLNCFTPPLLLSQVGPSGFGSKRYVSTEIEPTVCY